jgi:hypothetical protein
MIDECRGAEAVIQQDVINQAADLLPHPKFSGHP